MDCPVCRSEMLITLGEDRAWFSCEVCHRIVRRENVKLTPEQLEQALASWKRMVEAQSQSLLGHK